MTSCGLMLSMYIIILSFDVSVLCISEIYLLVWRLFKIDFPFETWLCVFFKRVFGVRAGSRRVILCVSSPVGFIFLCYCVSTDVDVFLLFVSCLSHVIQQHYWSSRSVSVFLALSVWCRAREWIRTFKIVIVMTKNLTFSIPEKWKHFN